MSNELLSKKLDKLAWLLDNSIKVPGTSWKIGLDGILGLLPGIGDLSAGLLSTYILYQAVKIKVPRAIIARMGLNVLLESVIGVIPIFGDLFDFAFKANQRNVDLMRKYVLNPRETTRQSTLTLIALVAFFFVVLGLMVWGMFALVAAVIQVLF
ncbi:DUF4112 domain-containing protein [uncultured Thiothrix sp.]|jgi:hypothetical protein|uniref:DUF4112 domain-containing protein n=1 Tax=uncultured Thiothrix sp. TaxID=223185 RepID=UPI00261AA5C7|nr:DUF4112 domain-containing protein [uncultured Thiothrix sp.]HMT92522.1 DUF4112 domain-containing protein [Thiolinea sp.]